MKKIAVFILVVILISCKTMKSPVYYYSDGSGNTYVVTKTDIEYIPVTADKSSSGFYKGGKPYKGSITEQNYKQVGDEFAKVFQNKAIQIETRMMTSGQLEIVTNGTKQTVIITKSKEQEDLEKLIKTLITP